MAERRAQVAVIGAGPTGLAAACAAAEAGATVVVLEDNRDPGGQIWRRERSGRLPGKARRWRDRAIAAGAEILTGTTLVDAPAPDRLLAARDDELLTVRCERLVLATGARERFLPFPGWTLPGVMGAGGLQALAKGGWPVADRRVVVAGSGPLLLAVADYLRGAGARVLRLVEQSPLSRVVAFTPHLLARPAKARQALRFGWRLRGVSRAFGRWPLRAEGGNALEAVLIGDGDRSERIECDLLACGFGLLPNSEIAAHLGCELLGEAVRVDAWQRTSRPEVLAAGEVCGIGGVDVAVVEGTIAGRTAAGEPQRAAELFGARARERRFGDALERTFRLRQELRDLPDEDTVFCRCEDVSWGQVRGYQDPRDAKLKTRCGMGPCQGRVCGAAGRFLLGWRHDAVRPPFYPVPVAVLAAEEGDGDAAVP